MAYRQDLFNFMLAQMRAGKTQEELSRELNQLVQDCRSTGKKGELTLTITVRPDKGDTGQYFLRPSIKTKSPQFEVGDTLFWGTPDGNLQRTDPAQGELELRAIPDTQKQPKFVDEQPQTVKQL
jgi:hypothetical protein